jgi:hypothetical protein
MLKAVYANRVRTASRAASLTRLTNMRAKSLPFHRLPLFAWSIFFTAFLLLLSLPVLAGAITMGRHFAVKFDSNQSQNFLESVDIATLLLFSTVLGERACNVIQRLFMDRLTNLTLCLDSTNRRVKEVSTFNGILNVRYRIMLLYITAQIHECSKRTSVFYHMYKAQKQGRILKNKQNIKLL